jgi:hypothetical protein
MEPGDEEWIHDEESAAPEDWPARPGGPRSHGGISGSLGFSWLIAALVAILAAAAGVAVALLIMPGH